MATNIITGQVLRNARTERHTPNWLKAVYAMAATLVAIVALSLTLAPSNHVLPACEWEDGSGNPGAPCFWDADTRGNHTGRDVLHYNGQVFVEKR